MKQFFWIVLAFWVVMYMITKIGERFIQYKVLNILFNVLFYVFLIALGAVVHGLVEAYDISRKENILLVMADIIAFALLIAIFNIVVFFVKKM